MDRPERFLISNAHSGTLVEVAIGSRLASTHESTSLQRWFIGLLVIVATCQVLGDGVLRSAVHGRTITVTVPTTRTGQLTEVPT